MYFLNFALANLSNAVEDEARCNTIGNAVAKSHKDAGKESRDCFLQVVPLNLLKGGHHHNTYRH